ncbi:hypothetical protein ABPG72_019826 [Tetrahymena utriculariae]
MEVEEDQDNHLSDLQKWGIVSFKYYTQMTERDIAELVGASQSAVNKIYSKWKKHNTIENLTKNNSRPSKLDVMDEEIQEALSKLDQKGKEIFKARDFKYVLNKELDIDISESTAQRWLKRLGYSHNSFKIYQQISEETRQSRLAYAHKYKRRLFNDTFFSDESAFVLNNNQLSAWTKDEEQKQIFKKQIPYYQSFLLVWGAISKKGKAKLYFYDSSITSETYIECLKSFLPQAKEMYKFDKFYFVQDNARPHVSKQTKEFLNKENINLFEHPAYSPDFNPIELIWSKMKKIFKILVYEKNIQTKQDSIKLIKQIWKNYIDQKFINSCIDNLKNYFDIAIENNGGILLN